MGAISDALRQDLLQPEFSEGYAESFLDSFIATQLKVLREQNGWSQAQLAERMGKKQTVISRSENVNYSSWNIKTLKQYARAFRLRLRVSFETYGSLVDEVDAFSRAALGRTPREKDPDLGLPEPQSQLKQVEDAASKIIVDIGNFRANTGAPATMTASSSALRLTGNSTGASILDTLLHSPGSPSRIPLQSQSAQHMARERA